MADRPPDGSPDPDQPSRKKVPKRRSSLANVEQRIATKERIESRYRQLTLRNANVVEALFTEAKESYATSRDRLSALDSKAATLIGIVTTGFGAIALLGDPTKTPSRGAWMAVALAGLAVAFAFALASLAPQPSSYPALSYYNILELVTNPANESRVKFDLTEAWLRDTQENYARGRKKASFLVVSIAALVLALSALAVNYLIANDKPTPSVRVIFDSPSPRTSTRFP